MSSINAQNVAKDVSESIRKGKKVKLGEIIKKNGYSDQTSKAPQRVTETKSFQEAIEPVVNKMIRERERVIQAMSEKNLSKEKYRDLTDGLDKLTKNVQLLSGKETEITTIIIEDQEKITNAVRNITTRDNRGSNPQGN